MELTNKLSAIGDAIREKTGKSELLTLDAMPGEIASIETGGGGSIEVEPIVLTGDCRYKCGGDMASKYIELFGNTVSTKNITDASYMFQNYKNEIIPFDINLDDNSTMLSVPSLFANCKNLKELPKIKGNGKIYNVSEMFSSCYNLREIPEDFLNALNISHWINATSPYQYSTSGMFQYCYSLRSLPIKWFTNISPILNYSSNYFHWGFFSCASLDELVNMPIPYTATYTSNLFNRAFNSCNRLKNLTFEVNEDGSPLEKNWKAQTIDLSAFVGMGYTNTNIISYNSDITADKEVVDDATYQALKNDPDWFTCDINYSRYNHDSAVRTINTLPDTSAYLATAGGTNTIKFKGTAGALTDGGAINTLTEEEIAVATAKGWTVSMA